MNHILIVLATLIVLSLAYHQRSRPPTHNYDDSLIVNSPSGQFQGSIIKSRLGKPIYSFRGIRYAEPPVGHLRFQPPVPINSYEGIYNATDDGLICPQPSTDPTSEDCLFLNVYSTKLPTDQNNAKRPVIVYFHSGGFYSGGSPSSYIGPQYFMDQDIVLVTFNYRLGSLGFLSTGTKEAPGNNGFKDQVVVLEWVQKNIRSFGGDPDSVTIQGYSAGAISVTLHMVSPMSVGLFHKAVAMSCSGIAQWTIDSDMMDLAKKQARFVNCPDDTPENIVNCLKTKSASEIGNSLPQFAEFGTYLLLLFKPVIENDFGQTRFLSEQPAKLIQSGNFRKVPFITGVTTEEFSYVSTITLSNETLTKELNDEWEKNAPIAFFYEKDTLKSKEVSRNLRKFYFDDEPVSNATQHELGELYADSSVGFGVNRAAKLFSDNSNVPQFYYKFSFQGRYSHIYLPDSNGTVPYGVVHHDDLIYLFYISKLFPYFSDMSSKEAQMVDKLTLLYANFAKYGNPIPKPDRTLENATWEPFNTETQKYLDIGNELKIKKRLFDDRYMTWERLFPL